MCQEMPFMNPYDPCVVEWLDIHSTDGGHVPEEFIEFFEPCKRKTAGFFLAVKHDHLFIAETDDREAKTDLPAERINSFPLAIVLSVRLLQ